MSLKNKSFSSEINHINFLDIVIWDLKSEIIEEAFEDDKLISIACKKRNLKHHFKFIKANRFIKSIVGFKKIIIKNENNKKSYLEFKNNKKFLRPIFHLLLILILTRNILRKNKYLYTFMVHKINDDYYFDNFNPFKNIEKHTPKLILIKIFFKNSFEILSNSIRIDSIIEEKFDV